MAETGLPTHDIFISYRRDGGDVFAKLLYETLRHKRYAVFWDHVSVRHGDFRDKILSTVRQAKDVLVILSKDCLERCRNQGDLFFEEIKEAIDNNKNTIPVFLKDFHMPTEEEAKTYPEQIQKLLRLHGYLINVEHYDSTLGRICEVLEAKPNSYAESDVHQAASYLLSNGFSDLREEEKSSLVSGVLASSYGIRIAEIMSSFLRTNPRYYNNIRRKFHYEISLDSVFPFGSIPVDAEKYFKLSESLSYRKHFLNETVGREFWISFVRNLDEVDDSLRNENYIFSENLLMDEGDLDYIVQLSPQEQKQFFTKQMRVRFNLNGKVLTPVELIINHTGIFAKYEAAPDEPQAVFDVLDVKIAFTIPHRKTASYFFASISDPTYGPHITFSYPEDEVEVEMISFMNRNITTANSRIFDGLREVSLGNEWVLPMSGVVFIITPI